jgi:hypothetical protein
MERILMIAGVTFHFRSVDRGKFELKVADREALTEIVLETLTREQLDTLGAAIVAISRHSGATP